MSNAEDLLNEWVTNRTKDYRGLNIKDFTSSWQDGLGFCALIHSYDKNVFDFSTLSARNPEKNLKLAFDKVFLNLIKRSLRSEF